MKSYRSHLASPLAILSWGMLLALTLDVPCFEPRASGMRGDGGVSIWRAFAQIAER